MEVIHVEFANKKVLFEISNPNESLQRILLKEHRFNEEAMLSDIYNRIKKDDIVIDVGANIGNHTLFFAGICGARVVAAEPFPSNYEHLVRNVALNTLADRVTSLNLALGDDSGRGSFELRNPKEVGGVMVRTGSTGGEIDIVRLDDLTLPGAPDLIKIDVEGAELAVLAGAERTIAMHKPLVYVEVWTPLVMKKVMAFFTAAGYRLVAGFNKTPTFLFAHRDDGRAAEDAAGIVDNLAMLAIAQYQIRRQAGWAQREAQRKRNKERKEKKKTLRKRLLRLLGGFQARLGGSRDAPSPESAASPPPNEVAVPPPAPARPVPAAPAEGTGPDAEEGLASVIRQGRQHLERRTAAWAETGLPFRPVVDQTAAAESGETDELPLVTILLATNRRDNLRNCRRNLINQDYPRLEPIVIVNKDDLPLEEVESILGDLPRLRVIRVPEHHALGVCLNEGMALGQGAYFAKVDDDDLYGPRYISDMVCSARHTRADLTGKIRCFYYFPATDELFLRASSSRKVAGATLFFTAQVAGSVRFPTTVAAGSDGGFVQECQRQGFTMSGVDPFNFCVLRHPDMARHTWVSNSQRVLNEAELVCKGLRLDIIDV